MKRVQRLTACLIALGIALYSLGQTPELAAADDCPLVGSCASDCATGACEVYGPNCTDGCDSTDCSGSQVYVYCTYKE